MMTIEKMEEMLRERSELLSAIEITKTEQWKNKGGIFKECYTRALGERPKKAIEEALRKLLGDIEEEIKASFADKEKAPEENIEPEEASQGEKSEEVDMCNRCGKILPLESFLDHGRKIPMCPECKLKANKDIWRLEKASSKTMTILEEIRTLERYDKSPKAQIKIIQLQDELEQAKKDEEAIRLKGWKSRLPGLKRKINYLSSKKGLTKRERDSLFGTKRSLKALERKIAKAEG